MVTNTWQCASANVGFGPTLCVCTDSFLLTNDVEIQTIARAAILHSKFNKEFELIRVTWATKVIHLGTAKYYLDVIIGLSNESGPQRQCNFVISQVADCLNVDPQFVEAQCNTGIQYLGFFIPSTLVIYYLFNSLLLQLLNQGVIFCIFIADHLINHLFVHRLLLI